VRVHAKGGASVPQLLDRFDATPSEGGWTVTVLPMREPMGALDLPLLEQWVGQMRSLSPREFSRAVAADEVDDLLSGGVMSAAEVAAALGGRGGRGLCEDDDDYYCGEAGWGVEALPAGQAEGDAAEAAAEAAGPGARAAAVRLAHSVRVDAIALHEVSRTVGAARGAALARLLDRLVAASAALSRFHAARAVKEAGRAGVERRRADALLSRVARAEGEARAAATLSSSAASQAADEARERAAVADRAEAAEAALAAISSELATLRQVGAVAAELVAREAARLEAMVTPETGLRKEASPVVASLRDVAQLLLGSSRLGGGPPIDARGDARSRRAAASGAEGRSKPSAKSKSASAAVVLLGQNREAILALSAAATSPGASGLAGTAEELEQAARATDDFLDGERVEVHAQQGDVDSTERLSRMMQWKQDQSSSGRPIFTG